MFTDVAYVEKLKKEKNPYLKITFKNLLSHSVNYS